MASLYDYGIPENTNNMIKLLDVISMDNARKEQANYNKILEQKATFEMDQAKQKEALLSKKIRFGDWMDAKGYNPAVKSRTLKYGQGLGYIDQMGDVEIRNMPTLLKTLSEDNEYQLGIMEDNYGHANQQHEMAKQKLAEFEEKNPFWETDPKANEERAKLALVQNQYARKVYNLQNSMNKLTGAKGGGVKVGGNPKSGMYTYDDEGNVKVIREPMKEEDNSAATAGLKEFEMVTGISPELRGTKQYEEAYSKFLRGKKQAITITQGRETPDEAGRKKAAEIEAKIKSAEKVLGRQLSDQEKRQMYLNDPYGIVPSGVGNPEPTGNLKTLDEKTAKSILAEAKGDKNKARDIAKSRGYIF